MAPRLAVRGSPVPSARTGGAPQTWLMETDGSQHSDNSRPLCLNPPFTVSRRGTSVVVGIKRLFSVSANVGRRVMLHVCLVAVLALLRSSAVPTA